MERVSESSPAASDLPVDLAELAGEYGVAADFVDWRGERVQIPAKTLVAVLAALGVDASSEPARAAALAECRTRQWRRVLPRYVVTREGDERTVEVHVDHGSAVEVLVRLEDGSTEQVLRQVDNWASPREIDGRLVGEASFAVPPDLPPGYHQLHAEPHGARSTLIVAPRWLGMPPSAGSRPAWGLATQLYSVRSEGSWGIGDLSDLADLAAWAATEHGAGFVLVNPMHAAEPAPPMDPSPYLPTTRRFANPLYLRPEHVPEYAEADRATRSAVAALRSSSRSDATRLDRDTSWSAKRAALQLLHRQGLRPGRRFAYRAYCRREGQALDDFATWCALTEVHGNDWHRWPAPLRRPGSREVAEFAAAHADRVDFHRWLQWLLDEQLAGAQAAAGRAGMSLGIVHDLAVGVSPTGADSWAWQDELARGITVGAPPDPYAQTGQDWNQPPWRPDRLAELAYAPVRELFRAALRHSAGLRIDHVIGLFRLWWIPQGMDPREGTYVRYDHDAFVATLMIEAQRAGTVVIGEDLGTVEPWVRDYLAERGILGTSILWFEFDWDGSGKPLPPERWREYCLASVTTHDLPPTAAYLAGDHVRLRHRLGLLTRPLEEELEADRADQEAWLGLLRNRGLLGEGADEEQTVTALHRVLNATPTRLRCLALTDAVGDRRTQNQPGTKDEYPNWRVPLSGPDGTPMSLEQVFASERAGALAETMRAGGIGPSSQSE